MSQKSQVEDQREFGMLTLCYNMQNTESENKNYKVGFGELFQLEIDFEIYLSIPALQLCWPGLGRAQHVLKPCRHTRRSQVHRVTLWLWWGFQNKNTGFPILSSLKSSLRELAVWRPMTVPAIRNPLSSNLHEHLHWSQLSCYNVFCQSQKRSGHLKTNDHCAIICGNTSIGASSVDITHLSISKVAI